MRERIRARGGQFKLTSAPGQGTTVEVELDVP
jgi:signal transduction histidine kinase